MKRCSRCIMPDTVPGISFDSQGVCSICQSYQSPSYLGEEELLKIFDEARFDQHLYDCVVPVSGGRDSTYVLYLAKKRYNLKTLAVHYDNEFATPEVAENLQNACDRLGVELQRVRSQYGLSKTIAKYSVLAASEFGQFRECAGCTYGYRSVVYKAAIKNKIPLIIWGESKEEATANLERRAFDLVRRHHRKFLKLLNKYFYLAEYYRLRQRLEFFISWPYALSREFDISLKNSPIKEIRIFDYVPWDRERIKNTITAQLRWKKASNNVSSWKSDCIMVALTNFYYISLFGCTKLCFGFCKMINSGQMSRDEALAQEEGMIANRLKGLRELLSAHLGLPEHAVNELLSHDQQFLSQGATGHE